MKTLKTILDEKMKEFVAEFTFHGKPTVLPQDVEEQKAWVEKAITSSLLAYREAVRVEMRGHGEENPNWPHNDDLNFLAYTPTGIWNAALQKVNQLSKEFFNE